MLKVAQVLKSNGTDGELVFGFRDIAPDDINTKEPVFIYFDGLPVPFFIESFSRKGNSKALVRLTDIGSYEDAEEIVGQGVFVEDETVEGAIEDDFSMLEGWTLKDENGRTVGVVTGYMDIPGNPCIEVSLEAEEKSSCGTVMIPLHEDLIVSVDESLRELSMSIPAGLI